MFKINIFAIAAVAMSLHHAQAFQKTDVIKVVGGLIDSIDNSNDLALLQQCMTVTDELFDDIQNMVDDYELGTGIMNFEKFYQDYPTTLVGCGTKVASDISQFALFMSVFSQPTTLAARFTYNMALYSGDIYSAMASAVANWKAQDYYNFGFKCGRTLFITFAEIPSPF